MVPDPHVVETQVTQHVFRLFQHLELFRRDPFAVGNP